MHSGGIFMLAGSAAPENL